MRGDQIPERLLVFGAGGFGREVAWLAGAALPGVPVEFVVDRPEYLTGPVDGHPVSLLEEVEGEGAGYVVALGDPSARRRAVEVCEQTGLRSVAVVHPGVDLRGLNTIGTGAVLCAGAILTTGITVGEHVHVNLASTIGHDVVIGEFSTIAPGANISGHVHLGRDVYIGTGATVINGAAGDPLVIGDSVVVAAGACVTGPVEAGAMVAGVPAVRKR